MSALRAVAAPGKRTALAAWPGLASTVETLARLMFGATLFLIPIFLIIPLLASIHG